MNAKINNSVKSLDNQAKQDEEAVNGKELTEQEKENIILVKKFKTNNDKSPGNLCNFGTHNPNYNKVYLSESNRKSLCKQ